MKRMVIAVCIFALEGCSDLSAVRDISSRLTSASNNWNDVSEDLAGSCQRERTINPKLQDCDNEIKASNGLVAADAVLGNYFKALTAAATETNYTVQPGLDKITDSVKAIPNVKKDQVTAVSGLVGLLVNFVTEKMREDTLRELIGDGAPKAQLVVNGLLSQVLVPDLKSRLGTERDHLTGYFAIAIGNMKDDVGSNPESLCSSSGAALFSATGFLLAQEYCSRLAGLEMRQKALDDYDDSLKAASKALTELQSSKAQLSAKALAQKLYVIGNDLDEKTAAVRKAFD